MRLPVDNRRQRGLFPTAAKNFAVLAGRASTEE
jgi:hypothetical protein